MELKIKTNNRLLAYYTKLKNRDPKIAPPPRPTLIIVVFTIIRLYLYFLKKNTQKYQFIIFEIL